MSTDAVRTTSKLSDKVTRDDMDRRQAELPLKSLDLGKNESKFAKALANLLVKLPKFAIEEEANESELCTRYIEPFLAGLFDDPDRDVFLRWTNETTLEFKRNDDDTDRRPDMTITRTCGVKWGTTCGYGEAKSAASGADHHAVCLDLMRLAVFAKDAMDEQRFEGILGIQIVGRMIKFYVLLLPARKLYTMLQLSEIKVPSCLRSLHQLATDPTKVLKILDVFDRLCVPAKDRQLFLDPRNPRQIHAGAATVVVDIDTLKTVMNISRTS
ncbi:hypothetical protein BCR43DRAFT_530658 [Syncephalastrum racemosum]|uniref:Fungal-type protein kinase domain-containing protein n=1 Tax=Syncephalastrum racemosum TaxID=13706 RepID=A0A1X2HF69_SYNRA|nr:hypothetical protein BCR43DRAFT_530658 [Syncephalastrum racemosum]